MGSHEFSAVADSLYLQDLLLVLPPDYRRALLLARHGLPRLAISSLETVLRTHPDHARTRADLEWLRARFAAGRR